jgi:hypothetical protein
MIVHITRYEFIRNRYYDPDADPGNKRFNFLRLRYHFITKTNSDREIGYHGYIESPSFHIQSYYSGNGHECLPTGLAEIWFTLFRPKPYLIVERKEQDYGEDSLELYFTEKYFYKPKFKAYDIVNVEFDIFFIKQPLKPKDIDITNNNPFLICPLQVRDITLVTNKTELELEDELPF